MAAALAWLRRQPPKVKAFLAVVAGMAALVFIRFIVHDHDNLFVAAEAAHAIGIAVLIYKLTKEKTCAGTARSPASVPPRHATPLLSSYITTILASPEKTLTAAGSIRISSSRAFFFVVPYYILASMAALPVWMHGFVPSASRSLFSFLDSSLWFESDDFLLGLSSWFGRAV
jgi:hypothetical protein